MDLSVFIGPVPLLDVAEQAAWVAELSATPAHRIFHVLSYRILFYSSGYILRSLARKARKRAGKGKPLVKGDEFAK